MRHGLFGKITFITTALNGLQSITLHKFKTHDDIIKQFLSLSLFKILYLEDKDVRLNKRRV